MKKFLLLFVMTLAPIVVSAYDVEVDGIYYNLITKAMQAEVTKGENRYTGIVKIPETINVDGTTYTVALIAEDAFSYNYSVTDIWIPRTITGIASRAFMRAEKIQSVHISDLEAWCKISFGSSPLWYAQHLFLNDEEVVNITIPQSITTIKSGTFSNLVNLNKVTFHENVEKIGDSAFSGCVNMESIQFPESLTEIWDYAFAGCKNLSFSGFPNKIKIIGSCAFSGCNSLTTLNIPASLTDINYAAFIDCGNLSTISVEKENPIYDSRNNCNAIIYTKSNIIFRACASTIIPDDVESLGQYAFSGCKGLTEIKIPNSVKLIGAKAFDGCENLKSITIGKYVTHIEDWAFSNCSNLMDFYIYTKEIPKIGSNNIFENSYIQYATLHVRESLIDLYSTTYPWNGFKTIEKINISMRTLTYNVDGEEYRSYQIEEGETITPEPVPTKEGYTFFGWSEIPATMPAQDVTVTGTFFKKGDANGDNTVNAADIVEVVNYIMENPSVKFNKTASDMNKDGEVNDADIKQIVNIIMESE